MDNTKVVLRILILDSIWTVLVFYCKFCAFKIILFTLHIFNFFYLEINKPDMHNNIIDISSSQYGFNNFLNSTGFLILRIKL